MHYCLLPGLHGDASLLSSFIEKAPAGSTFTRIEYPKDTAFDYHSLLIWIKQRLPTAATYTLVGESYGGPLAILIASAYPSKLEKVVLVGSFARLPRPWVPEWIPHGLLNLLPHQTRLPRILLAGLSRSKQVDNKLKESLAKLTRQAFLGRTKAIRNVDVRKQIAKLTMPLLYLQASKDYLVPAARGQEIVEISPSGKLIRIDGPHLLLGTNPTACWEAITAPH